MSASEVFRHPEDYDLGTDEEPGWYYWYCMPGCLPDSDPMGPFETREAAHADSILGEDDA